ncbi:unnamed protein product [Brachionus calyciflorus]|uniref:Uncharacterized protein n=1 Tax=Brachionus calyciflorus TaxID=104777 RepID=A0A813TKI2_9BILA|nr:unnamed protein product [Brachionus calyciflorus]
MTKYKIFVFSIPASGHVNPLLPVLNELCKYSDIEVIVYLTEEFRPKFESVGTRFKSLKNFDFVKNANFKPFGKSRYLEIIDLMTLALNAIAPNFEFIAKEIDEEKPNLILYDTFGIYIKWAMNYYLKKMRKSQVKWPLPPMIGFSATFIYNEGIYPNQIEKSLFVPFNFRFLYDISRIFITSLKVCLINGISFINPLDHFKMKLDSLTKLIICVIFPALHPRSHLYDTTKYKFVGSTIEGSPLNQIFSNQSEQEPFKTIFNSISVKSDDSKNDYKLVYVSLGTLFNNNFDIFKKIIDAFVSYDEGDSNEGFIKLSNLKVIVSAGEKCFKNFQLLIESKKYSIPENIYIVKSAPQVEILKRASLFVTHSGMNSTSESIHYAVPMICIPLSEDQPVVAYRVADELGLGIRLDYTKMDSNQIKNSVKKILNDESYNERLNLYSKMSQNNFSNTDPFSLNLNYETPNYWTQQENNPIENCHNSRYNYFQNEQPCPSNWFHPENNKKNVLNRQQLEQDFVKTPKNKEPIDLLETALGFSKDNSINNSAQQENNAIENYHVSRSNYFQNEQPCISNWFHPEKQTVPNLDDLGKYENNFNVPSSDILNFKFT